MSIKKWNLQVRNWIEIAGKEIEFVNDFLCCFVSSLCSSNWNWISGGRMRQRLTDANNIYFQLHF